MQKTVILRLLYTTIITLALPFAVLRLFLKSRKNTAYRKRIPERFACNLPNTQQNIWIHAVSVGEFLAILPLIRELQKEQQQLLITTTTPTGSAMVKEQLGETVSHCYLPFDNPLLVRRFLKKTKPLAAIFMETEIWPNYLHQLKKNATPTLLINARLSEKSFAGYEKFGSFARYTLACFTEIACQNELSQNRFLKLGANASMLGNIKFDLSPPDDLTEKTSSLKALMGNQPFIIGASTHKGEDEIILEAYKNSSYANTHRLVIAPRHPERSKDILAICNNETITAIQYTQAKNLIPTGTRIIVIDTLGELLYFYALADAAIIGGSFVNHGGHNPLEAALFSTPCIIGTYYFNFESLIKSMQQANAIVISESATLLQNTNELDNIGKNAKSFLEHNQGSLERYKNLVLSLV